MEDFEEWFEGTGGIGIADGEAEQLNPDEAEGSMWDHSESEVVVCLVDCRTSMFHCAVEPSTESEESVSNSNDNSNPTLRNLHNVTRSIWNNGNAFAGSVSSAESSPSFFTMTLQSIRRLFTGKIVAHNRDMVAVVLYNTREHSNDAGFAGIYVAQEAACVGNMCVEKVEQLEAAGVHGSPAYDAFVERIGHSPGQTACDNSSEVEVHGVLCEFSNVLSVAEGIFSLSCDSRSMQNRRLFVFTNDSDPTHGCLSEWERCCQRAHTLGDAGVEMEVFGFGNKVEEGVSGVLPTAAERSKHQFSLSRTSLSGQTDFPTSNRIPFQTNLFWEKLLRRLQATSTQPTSFVADRKSTESAAAITTAAVPTYCRAAFPLSSLGIEKLHVYEGAETLGQLLRTVARRAHLQRPYRHCELRIGRSTQQQQRTAGNKADLPPAAVPRMAVSLYTPLMPARPLPIEHVDKHTRQVVRRVTHLYKTSDADRGGDAADAKATIQLAKKPKQENKGRRTEEEVSAKDVCYYVKVRDERVCFTKEERRQLVEVAAGEAELGFTVLIFKDAKDVVQTANIVERASFLHARMDEGGPQSHRLFVLLVRRLRAKGKAAIAQYRSTNFAAPRLVALVPSPELDRISGKSSDGLLGSDQLPVQGLGLYVVPLPYAEDLRPFPSLRTTASVNPMETPYLKDSTVDPVHRALAMRVIAALTVPYGIDKVPNPTLQRQFASLQRLAKRLYPLHSDPHRPDHKDVDISNKTEDADFGFQRGVAADTEPPPVDASSPDYEAMAQYTTLFDAFKAQVLGLDYKPVIYCPQPAVASKAARRPHAAIGRDGAMTAIEEIIRDAAARNAWELLSIRTLKEYLSSVGVSFGGAQLKNEFIRLAMKYVAATKPPC